jgi:hypothetical protein
MLEESPRHRWAALALIAASAVLRLIYLAWLCPLELAPDEAYYWDWSRQIDWGYHSKGPLVAWLIRLSCLCLGDTTFAVRVPAVLCGALLLAGLFTLTRQVYKSDRHAFAMVAFGLTLPVLAAGSSLMTIDAPFTCAWMWALVFAHAAVLRNVRWAWPATGTCILLGMLAKHTMVLWAPSFTLLLVTTPTLRGVLHRPGFWIMIGLGALGGVPILIWNMQRGWVTLHHAQQHAGFEEDAGLRWLGPLNYVGGQCAILLGFWFVLWVVAMWRHRPMVEAQAQHRFLWWMSAPTFVFFGLFALKNGGGEANWPMPAYLSGMVLAAGLWSRDQWSGIHSRRWIFHGALATAAVGILAISLMHQPTMLQPIFLRIAGPATVKEPTPIRRIDPTCRLRGWRHLAADVDRICESLRDRNIEPIIAGERWTLSGELAFHCDRQPTVYCVGQAFNDRESQYDLWRPNPVADIEQFRGRTFVVVGLDLERLRPAFEAFEPIRTSVYREQGTAIATWSIAVGHGFRGWGWDGIDSNARLCVDWALWDRGADRTMNCK